MLQTHSQRKVEELFHFSFFFLQTSSKWDPCITCNVAVASFNLLIFSVLFTPSIFHHWDNKIIICALVVVCAVKDVDKAKKKSCQLVEIWSDGDDTHTRGEAIPATNTNFSSTSLSSGLFFVIAKMEISLETPSKACQQQCRCKSNKHTFLAQLKQDNGWIVRCHRR